MKTKIICLGICFAFFLAACSGKKNYEIANSSADSVHTFNKADTAFSTLKLVKTANMRFKVKNVRRTCEDVSTLASNLHGLVMHHVMQSNLERSYNNTLGNDSIMHISSYSTIADMTVKIPSDKMEDFMNTVGKMAVYVDTLNMNIEDKTLAYLSANLKARSRSQAAQTGSKNTGSELALKNDLIDQKINNRLIDQDVKYSTVALSFYQTNTIVKEVVVNDDPSSFRQPILTRLGDAIANGWYGFTEVMISLANLWVIFAVGVVGWYVYWIFRKKRAAKVA